MWPQSSSVYLHVLYENCFTKKCIAFIIIITLNRDLCPLVKRCLAYMKKPPRQSLFLQKEHFAQTDTNITIKKNEVN